MTNFCANCGHSIHAMNSTITTPTSSRSRTKPKTPRKPSAANKAYARAFNKVSSRYRKKSGGWKQNGFRDAVRAAHKLSRRKK